MLLWLADWLGEYVRAFNVFNYVTLRAVLASLTALGIGLALEPWVIRKLAEVLDGAIPIIGAGGITRGGDAWDKLNAGASLVGTLALLFIVPAMFIVFQAIQEKVRPIQFDATVADWQIKEEVEKADEERKQYLENKKK